MENLKLFAGMDDLERARSLEKVIKGQARLFISINYCGWLLFPIDKYGGYIRIGRKRKVDFDTIMQECQFAEGFIEFVNASKIASELVSMNGQSGPLKITWRSLPLFYDEKGRPSFLGDFQEIAGRFESKVGHISMVQFEITLKFLAVSFGSPEKVASRTDPIKSLMMQFLESTQGAGRFDDCIAFLMKDWRIDEDIKGRFVWAGHNGKNQSSTRKSMQNRFNRYKKNFTTTV